MKRIHDGAIGDIVASRRTSSAPPYGLQPRKPGQTEVQYQCSNQYHFTWLSGDDVPQSLVHNVDRAAGPCTNSRRSSATASAGAPR